MAISETQAFEILNNLITNPNPNVTSGPLSETYANIITAHNKCFPVAVEPTKKKRRRKSNGFGVNTNVGWPAGVKRAEYLDWKEEQLSKGVTEGINPQEYKRQRDGDSVASVTPTTPRVEINKITTHHTTGKKTQARHLAKV